MRCSKCGKEFGEGVNCHYCGVDRVTGLANYSSYGTSDYQGTNTSHYDSSYNSSPKTMVCYACSEIIPSNSEYCPHCRKKLFETCPKCGHKYSSQYLNCNQCGTNRKEYYEQKEKERRKKLERQKKEQEERVKKEQEQIEAIKLREQLTETNSTVEEFGELLMLLGIVSFIAAMILSLSEANKFFILTMSLIGVGVLFLITGGTLTDIGNKNKKKKTQHNIIQWKQEHPNDPRSKYL